MGILSRIYEVDYTKIPYFGKCKATVRQNISTLTLRLNRKRSVFSRQDEAPAMKKTTQSLQALKFKIIRLSWLRHFLISLRYMEVPEHSILQTWMCPTK
jgi:hypothetical protein